MKDIRRSSPFDKISDEILLERLLRRCEPNPREKAHLLLTEMGSIANVIDAQPEDLADLCSLSGESVELIHLVAELQRRYLLVRSRSDLYLKDRVSIAQYLMPLFAGESEEVIYLLSLNNARMVLGCTKLNTGNIDQVNLSLRTLVSDAMQRNATHIVLAHNHPSGIAVPSMPDIVTTRRMGAALGAVDITLEDHIVVAGRDYVSLVQSGYYDPEQCRMMV